MDYQTKIVLTSSPHSGSTSSCPYAEKISGKCTRNPISFACVAATIPSRSIRWIYTSSARCIGTWPRVWRAAMLPPSTPYETDWQHYCEKSRAAVVTVMNPVRQINPQEFLFTLGEDELRHDLNLLFRARPFGNTIGSCRRCCNLINLCLLDCLLCQCEYPFLSANTVIAGQDPFTTKNIRLQWFTDSNGAAFKAPARVLLCVEQMEQQLL